MKFNSLGQFFYKLYTFIFVLMLWPIAVFIFLYKGLQFELLKTIALELAVELITYTIVALAVILWLLTILVFRFKLKAIRKISSLGERLSRYASLCIKYNAWISLGMLLLAGGYYLTENKWITIIFIASLMMPLLQWPFPRRVCKDLKLKGDEHMMVLYRMDSF